MIQTIVTVILGLLVIGVIIYNCTFGRDIIQEEPTTETSESECMIYNLTKKIS